MGLSFREIASRLQIGVGTAHRIYTRFVDTGEVSPAPRRPRPDSRKLDDLHELFIIAIIAENPTLYLSEICSKIYEITNVTVLPPLFVAYCTKMDVRERSFLRWPSNDLLITEEISWHIYCSILAISLFGLMRQAQIGEISSGNLAIL